VSEYLKVGILYDKQDNRVRIRATTLINGKRCIQTCNNNIIQVVEEINNSNLPLSMEGWKQALEIIKKYQEAELMDEITVKAFNYSQLDGNTASFLKEKEFRMREISGKLYTELGRELKEAQDALAEHRYGCFEEWYTSLGFKKTTVYKLIDRFVMINCSPSEQLKNVIEELPVSQTYALAKSDKAEEIINKASEDNMSLEELKKFIKEQLAENKRSQDKELLEAKAKAEKELEETKSKANVAVLKEKEESAKRIEAYKAGLVSKEFDLKIQAKDKEIADLENKINLYQKDGQEYRKLKENIDFLRREKSDLARQIDSATELSGLTVKLYTILRTELAPIKFGRNIEQLEESDTAVKKLTEIIEMVESWAREMRQYLPNNNIINAEVIK
jgi:hypothetical protein